jgi:hypothetical protein
MSFQGVIAMKMPNAKFQMPNGGFFERHCEASSQTGCGNPCSYTMNNVKLR